MILTHQSQDMENPQQGNDETKTTATPKCTQHGTIAPQTATAAAPPAGVQFKFEYRIRELCLSIMCWWSAGVGSSAGKPGGVGILPTAGTRWCCVQQVVKEGFEIHTANTWVNEHPHTSFHRYTCVHTQIHTHARTHARTQMQCKH